LAVASGSGTGRPEVDVRQVEIPTAGASLDGDLALPASPRGVVLFAHGSGSSRHSPRNRKVAEALQQAGWATLLVDLLTPDEEKVDLRTAELRFDIGLLASRLEAAIDWLAADDRLGGSPVVTFGASTGAAAALIAAAERPERVRAVVSRGGRPDLADDSLARVAAPTLLIVGGDDPTVLRLNEDAARQLPGEVELEVVPGASHLFEEPGTLDRVVELVLASLDRWVSGTRRPADRRASRERPTSIP
jgi:putative phosphoribosyl transferase